MCSVQGKLPCPGGSVWQPSGLAWQFRGSHLHHLEGWVYGQVRYNTLLCGKVRYKTLLYGQVRDKTLFYGQVRDSIHFSMARSGTRHFCMARQDICFTLRSWLHKISALIMTLSPGLEKNYTLERSSKSFTGITSMSGCLENCQNNIPKSQCSPI